ncbi:MAG: VWA domain-containing protein, partial [Gammaproteobacteria bacterium]
MSIHRRRDEPISIAFLDVITCGFGAIILLLMIAKFGDPPEIISEDPRAAQISAMQRTLFELRGELTDVQLVESAKRTQLDVWRHESQEMTRTLNALRESTAKNTSTAALNAIIAGELKTAHQELTEEMKRLYAQRNRKINRNDLIGGIPVDSEYIVFIIDTSGSMFRYAWPKVIAQIVETLEVYPKVKGIQILNDMGSYM